MSHTHVCVKYRRSRRCGWRLHGHRLPVRGVYHACVGGPEVYRALCGEKVYADIYDEFEMRRPNPTNVDCVDSEACPAVTCKRCKAAMRSKTTTLEEADS